MKIRHKGKFTSVPFKKKVSNLRPNKKRPKQTEEKEQTEKREEFQPASWRDGRRIVELGLLADRLKECRLRRCRQPLHLSDVTSETIYGLGSILHIRCRHCGKDNLVPTGKRHRATGDKGPKRCFDAKTKLSEGIFLLIIIEKTTTKKHVVSGAHLWFTGRNKLLIQLLMRASPHTP